MKKTTTLLLIALVSSSFGQTIKVGDNTWNFSQKEPFLNEISSIYKDAFKQETLIISEGEPHSIEEIIKTAEDAGWENNGARKLKDRHVMMLSQSEYRDAKALIGVSYLKEQKRKTYWVKKESTELSAQIKIQEWANENIQDILKEVKEIHLEKYSKEENKTLSGDAHEKALNDPLRKAVMEDLSAQQQPTKKGPPWAIIIGGTVFLLCILTSVMAALIMRRKKSEDKNQTNK